MAKLFMKDLKKNLCSILHKEVPRQMTLKMQNLKKNIYLLSFGRY